MDRCHNRQRDADAPAERSAAGRLPLEWVNPGKFWRGVPTGHRAGAERKQRALTVGNAQGGGYLVPTPLSVSGHRPGPLAIGRGAPWGDYDPDDGHDARSGPRDRRPERVFGR